jgi:hypothetical protein
MVQKKSKIKKKLLEKILSSGTANTYVFFILKNT